MWFQENEITHACDKRSVTDPHPVSPPKKEKKYFKQQTSSIQSSCGMQTGEYLVFWLIWTSRMAYYLTRSGENIKKNVEFQVMTMFSENKLNYLKCIKNHTNDILTGGLVGWGPENSVPSTIKEAMKPCCLQKFHASQSLNPKKAAGNAKIQLWTSRKGSMHASLYSKVRIRLTMYHIHVKFHGASQYNASQWNRIDYWSRSGQIFEKNVKLEPTISGNMLNTNNTKFHDCLNIIEKWKGNIWEKKEFS